ncbi:hypothetical protein QOZ80_8BG0668790 [Eleusine coracana subsp. coracana]|nr:hypothetical protein QOZ80_8BG0668790 [Eleusine coracana subsp. coracana]
MGRSYYACPQVDALVRTPIPGVALDMLFLVAIQGAAVIVLGKFLHLFLRRYNQPSAVSQILAGVAVGGMGLRSAIVHVDVDNVEDMYGGYISAARLMYVFLVGLDLDLAALQNATRRCVAFTYAIVAASLLVAAIVSSGLYGSMMHSPVRTPELLAATLMVALTNTSSISVARIAGELNLRVTENGRLVVASAIATNLICVLGDGVLSSTALNKVKKTQDIYLGSPQITKGFLALAVAGAAVWAVRPAVIRVNARNVGRHHVRTRDLAAMLTALWSPPFYFATIGMRLDFNAMSGAIIVPGVLLTLLGLFGKAVGAAAAAPYLDIPVSDALRYSVLLNVKGHVDTMNMKFAKLEGVWAEQALYAMIIGNLISTLIAGPAAAAVLRKEKEAYRTRHQAVESVTSGGVTQEEEEEEEDPLPQELRMCACVHSAHAAPGVLSLAELLVSAPQAQPAIHVLHFFEVQQQQQQPRGASDDSDDDEEEQTPDAVTEMNTVVDVFARATGVSFRQVDVVRRGAAKDAQVACRRAAEAHTALLILPCYKEQRYDGRMACRLEERRQLNHHVLACAPCSVGLLVDRPYRSSSGAGATFQTPTSLLPPDTGGRTLLHPCSDRAVAHVVAALFFGGPDDREAVSVGARLAEHPTIGLTVFRFVQRSTYDSVTSSTSRARSRRDDVVVPTAGEEGDVDERFLWRFYENYASREMAMYVEKVVETPADVVETLQGMAGMFSLVIVGRGGRQPVELMAGLERWAEAGGELGPVAEILASIESMEMGSVLVMQQHKVALMPSAASCPRR